MKKILLCPPAFYDIEYEINPWMHLKNKVNRRKVYEEYKNLKATYESLGVEVLEINPVKGLPDMVYAANLGFPLGNKFVLANFKYKQRRKEADYAKVFFQKLGFEIVDLPDKLYFEGQGDLLTVGGKFFLGWGKRSSKEMKDVLNDKVGIKCIDLELQDPYFYHLDMSLGPLDSKTALVRPGSFIKEGLSKLRKEFPNIIETTEKDDKFMACNLVVVGKTVIIAKGISAKLKSSIRKYGFKVVEIPMDEFRKGGGSIKCLTLEFY
jgi:N-dimethylarginine dimethylaminohydrolase